MFCKCALNFQHLLKTFNKVKLNNFSIFTDKMFELLCQLKIVHSFSKKCRKAIHFCWKAVNFNSSVFCTHLSIEMQTTILLDRKRPKMRKNEQTRQRISPAHHETVIAQMISRGIMKKVTWKRKIDEISQKTTNLENWHRC